MEKIILWEPAYDKTDPDPKKNYGVHGVNIRFVLKGEEGATQFLLYTNWHLPHIQKEQLSKYVGDAYLTELLFLPTPADLGYHSRKPLHEWHDEPTSEKCEYLDGAPCYYDGSSLNADRVFDILVEKGDQGVWDELQNYYDATFTKGETP